MNKTTGAKAPEADSEVIATSSEEFDPNTFYRIEVNRVVKIGGIAIRPKGGGTVRGDFAVTIRDAIVSFEAQEV